VSRDSVAEGARGLSGIILDVPANRGHGEGTARGARVVTLKCGPLFRDAPSAAGLFPKRDGSGVLGAISAADLINCEETRKSAGWSR
jgi:hypothetical protein